jgi:MFS family permease
MKRSLGPAFNALFVGSLITNTGDGIRLAALPLLAATLTDSPLLVSGVTAAQLLPWVIFGPIGGVFVDRWDRRRTILVTQAWRGLVMALFGLLVLSDLISIWHLFVAAFVITVGEILVDPSVVALVPKLVDDDQLDTANARIASVEIVTNQFAGAPVGAATFAFAPWLPFVLDGATYLGSILPFRRLPTRSEPPADAPAASSTSIHHEAAEGIRWLRAHTILGPLTAAIAWLNLGGAAAFSLLVLLVTKTVGASEFVFGLLLAAGAIGAFLGSISSARVTELLGRRLTVAGGAAAHGLAWLAMSRADSTPALLIAFFFSGVPIGILVPVTRGIQQRLAPNDMLGRVNVSARILTRGSMVVGALLGGALATMTSVRWSFVFAAAIELSAAAAMWVILGRGAVDPHKQTEMTAADEN